MPRKANLGFDLETCMPIPDYGDGVKLEDRDYCLGVACAAAFDEATGEAKVWPSQVDTETQRYPGQLTPADLKEMLAWLWSKRKTHRLVSWNGMGFDFRVIAQELKDDSDALELCRKLAWRHVDVGFEMLCCKGYMVGLASAAGGMLGASKEMDGKEAPKLWDGSVEDQQQVLSYVVSDATLTAQVATALETQKKLTWTAKSGKANKWFPLLHKGRLLSVTNASKVDKPDVSWMSDPLSREEICAWAWS